MPAAAGDLTVQTKVSETVERDDNPLLLSTGAKAVTGSITSPEAIVGDDSATGHADIDTRLDLNAYDLPGFSSMDVHTAYHTSYKGETTQLGLNGGLDYDTTRTSELTASGVNTAGIRHTGINLSPQAGFNLTPIDQAVVNASMLRSIYGNTTLYTNYDFYTLSPGLQHSFDPLDTGLIAINAAEFRTISGLQSSTNSIGPSVGWTRKFSENFTATTSVGLQRTINHAQAGVQGSPPGSWDFIYNFDLAYQGVQDVLHLTSSRASSPEGNGAEALMTSFGLTETHTVTTQIDGALALQYQFQSYSLNIPGVATDFLSVSPSLRYHFTENWTLAPSFRYRRQDVLGIATAQSSSAITVNLTYTPVRWLLGL